MFFVFLAMALNAAFPYYNLRNLSQLFKDNLANPLLCKLLEGKTLFAIFLIYKKQKKKKIQSY